MKIINLMGNEYKMIVGSAREIKNLYRNLTEREICWSIFSEEPKFVMNRYYGITMNYNDEDGRCFNIPQIYVVNEHTIVELLNRYL